MTSPFEAIEAAKSALRAGLDALSSVDEADDLASLDRVLSILGKLDDPVQLRARVEPGDLERFDDQLDEVVRLNAVLVSAAVSERDRLIERLGAVRQARRDLGRHVVPEPRGGRCDIAG